MRNFTYFSGARFSVNNIFRSLRFDVDRLDISWVDDEMPEFARGLRIVDNEESNTVTVDGRDADCLVYSLTYIFGKENNQEDFRASVDKYLAVALETKEYLCTKHAKDPEGKSDVAVSVIH